jgi:hypothetical protein
MSIADCYSDNKFSTPAEILVAGGAIVDSNQAAAVKFQWRPFVKMKVSAVCASVVVAGSLACGFTVFRGTTSIGAIVCSASAAGYRGTYVPTGTNAIYDTTDTLVIKNIDSNASLTATLNVVYQNQY